MDHSLAMQALESWGLAGAELKLLAQRENLVYSVTPKDGSRFALRLHRPGYQTSEAVKSELAWMSALRKSGIAVPEPIATVSGQLLIAQGDYHIDMLSWLGGRPLGATGKLLDLEDRTGTFRDIGRLMASIHNQADDWAEPDGFIRMAWDHDGLLGDTPLWGRFWENPELTSDQRNLLLDVRDYAAKILREQQFDYGLIHADMVRENTLIGPDALQLLDFDDCGYGYRLFDVATTLIKNWREADQDQLQDALIKGYCELRELDTNLLPLFMMLRACTYVGWIVPRIDEPGSPERQQRFIAQACKLATNVLSMN